jgi:dinuclear metal center YbgI/SA1388 family protein
MPIMEREKLVKYLDEYLKIGEIKDYGPQGLQVETENETINRIALSVDAAPAVIEAAAEWGADMLLAHHGVLWRSVERIAGPLGRRVRLFMKHGINLYAAHLPLDAHPEVGNNAVLAGMLDVAVQEWWCMPTGVPIGVFGAAPAGTTLEGFAGRIETKLNTKVRVLAYGPNVVQNVAIISGFGVDEAAGAKAMGADTFVTGETSHTNYWDASDLGMNIIFAGHYATETVGVQALGRHLVEKFGLEVRFFDFPTGM